jgi:hypothetical protein
MSENAPNQPRTFVGSSPALERATDGKQRIGIIMAIFLIASAFLVDCLQAVCELFGGLTGAAVPLLGLLSTAGFFLIGTFLGIAANLVFLIWLKVLGVEYLGRNAVRKFLTVGAMTSITIIPGLDILPELTAGVTALVLQTRYEDAHPVS